MNKIFIILFVFVLNTLTSYSQVSTDTLKVINLNSVEVTSLRPSSLTPISQKTITSIDIKKEYHGQEMTYILEKTPSVTTNSDGGHPNGYTYFRIRGIDQTRINVTLNGSPLNEIEDQGAYYSNYPGFATYIKSLQVQRGVGTSSNGTASFGGSISFETKDGLDKGIDGSITVGSFNTRQLTANYGSGLLKNNLAFFVGLSTYSSDGYRQKSDGSGSSAFISGGYYGKKDIVKLTAFTGISNNNMSWLPSPESAIKIKRDTNILSPLDKDFFNQTFVQLKEVHSFSSNFVMSNTLFYNNLNGWFNIHFTDYPTYVANYKSNFYGLNTNFKYNSYRFKFNTGLNANKYNRKHFGSGVGDFDGTYNNIGYKNDYSVYFKPEYTYNKLNIYSDLQLRKVQFNYVGKDLDIINVINTRNFFNFGLGGTYTLNNKEKVYLYFGKTHREPTRTDMFKGTEYYINGLTNINLVSESVNDFELGYKLNTDKLNINTNFYFMYFNNQYIPSGKLDANSLMEMKAVDKSYRVGIEFDGKYKITDNLSTSNFTTLSRNKILSNGFDHVLYSPSIILNQDVEYKISNFYININAKYVSETYINLNDKNAYCPDYITLNSIVGFSNNLVDLSVTCINLTNTNYYTFGNVSSDGTKNYFVGAPISFYTTLKIKL